MQWLNYFNYFGKQYYYNSSRTVETQRTKHSESTDLCQQVIPPHMLTENRSSICIRSSNTRLHNTLLSPLAHQLWSVDDQPKFRSPTFSEIFLKLLSTFSDNFIKYTSFGVIFPSGQTNMAVVTQPPWQRSQCLGLFYTRSLFTLYSLSFCSSSVKTFALISSTSSSTWAQIIDNIRTDI